jgi:hypothetical protein
MIGSFQVVWEVGQRVFAADELNKILQRGRARESAEGFLVDAIWGFKCLLQRGRARESAEGSVL